MALGDTPQVAACLQEQAAPNTVIVSDATWRLVQGYFTGHALEPRALSDAATLEQVYQVLGTSGAQSRLDAVTPRGLTPLVGREAELALLRDRWAQARALLLDSGALCCNLAQGSLVNFKAIEKSRIRG